MKKSMYASIGLLVAAVILTVVSILVLPQTVVTQLSIGSSDVTTMPKFVAIGIPLVLSVGGAVSAITLAQDNVSKRKSFIVSGAGILVFVIMLVVNAVSL